jgi:hypothetical protein
MGSQFWEPEAEPSPSSLLSVNLEKEDGQQRQLRMSPSKTIAEVLLDYTPAELKKANAVIVVEGAVCRNNLRLGEIAPTDGRPLHLTIQRSNIMEVRLEKNGGQSKHVWMTLSMTIAQVLNDWTPEHLKDANPVVVVNGALAQPDMVLSGFPRNGGLLRMTIQRPMEW